jgi:hypothetical protein
MEKQTRGNKYALAALKRQRAEMAGKIVELKKKLEWAENQLVHLDGTLKLLDPTSEPSQLPTARPKRMKLFKQGELSGTLIDVLRKAEGPLLTDELATSVLRKLGYEDEARPAMTPRIRSSLLYLCGKDRVTRLHRGRKAMWKLDE